MAKSTQSGNGRKRNKETRQPSDQRGRRASDSNGERSGSYGNSSRRDRGAAYRAPEGPPYSRGGRVNVDDDDDDNAFGTHEAGEDRDNYNATADHLHDPGPQSFQGIGFFDDGAPYNRGGAHVGMGHAVGYGPGPNPSPGLGFRGRGPKGYQRSDERLLEEINERLTHDDDIDAHEISVSVEKGEVTLTGTVGSRAEKRRADDIAEEVSGVQHVQNNLRVHKQNAK